MLADTLFDCYILNNYPVTKNKPIYHVRISKQMKGRAFSERDKSVYVWSRDSVINFIMQRKPTNREKNSPDVSRLDQQASVRFRSLLQLISYRAPRGFRHFVNLVNSSAVTPQNDPIALDFVDNLNSSFPLFHLRNVA